MRLFGAARNNHSQEVPPISTEECTDSANSDDGLISNDESSATRVIDNRSLDDESATLLKLNSMNTTTDKFENMDEPETHSSLSGESTLPSSSPFAQLFRSKTTQVKHCKSAVAPEPDDALIDAKKDIPSSRGAWIKEEPDSFESIDSSKWPRSWNAMPLTKTAIQQRRRRCQLILVFTILILLCTIIGVVVSQGRKDQTTTAASLRTSSSVAAESAESQVTDNVFDEGQLEGNSTSNPVVTIETPLPTGAPTEARDTCEDFIRPDQRCYNRKDLRDGPFTIGFVRCEPHHENWVGIFEAGLDPDNLPDPLMWVWTCDSQDIADCNNEGTISGALAVSGVLQTGFYQAHLVERDGSAPYVAFVSSDVFQISKDCSM